MKLKTTFSSNTKIIMKNEFNLKENKTNIDKAANYN